MSLTSLERKANDARRWADRDAYAESLKQRFGAAARWNDRPITLSLLIRSAVIGLALGAIAVAAYKLYPSIKWPDATSTSVAPATCADARRMGIAPMRRGEPGYRPSLGADSDGIACEPYVKR